MTPQSSISGWVRRRASRSAGGTSGEEGGRSGQFRLHGERARGRGGSTLKLTLEPLVLDEFL